MRPDQTLEDAEELVLDDSECAEDLSDTAHTARRGGERGQGMVEYGFIIALIVLVVIIMLQVLGHQVNNLYSNVANGLNVG